MNLPKWEQINELGKLKIFRIAMVFFVLMPIFVRLFEHVPKQIYLLIQDKPYLIELTLPFNWFLLYIASLLITIGSIAYHLFCPKIITLFSDYHDFYKSGMTKSFLYRELKNCISKKDREKNSSEIVRSLLKRNDCFLDKVNDKDEIDSIIRVLDPRLKLNQGEYEKAMKSAFFFVRDSSQLKGPWIRFFTSLFYFAGLLLVLFVILEKIIYVLNYVLK